MRFQFLFAAFVIVLAAGCSAEPPVIEEPDSRPAVIAPRPTKAEKYETPEAVFAAYQAAAQKGDFTAAAQCMTEESQTLMTGSIVLMAIRLGSRDEAVRDDLEAELTRHGVDHTAKPSEDLDLSDQMALMKWAAEPVVNKPACIGGLYDFFKAHGRMSGEIPMASGKLHELKTVGDNATALVTGPKGNSPLEFVKVNDSWRIQFPKEVLAGQP